MLKRRKINENDKFCQHKNECCLLFQYLMREEENLSAREHTAQVSLMTLYLRTRSEYFARVERMRI